MEKILSGKPIAAMIRNEIIEKITNHNLNPQMLLIQIGGDSASEYYVQSIIKNGKKLGCDVHYQSLPSSTTQEQLIHHLRAGNVDSNIHGIMLQKPLPRGFDENIISLAVSPEKDIDGIHPLNLGKTWMEMESFIPCTAQAVIETLKYYNIKTEGKKVVILGRSTVVGKPLAALLLSKNSWGNATLSVCHSKTIDLHLETRSRRYPDSGNREGRLCNF